MLGGSERKPDSKRTKSGPTTGEKGCPGRTHMRDGLGGSEKKWLS